MRRGGRGRRGRRGRRMSPLRKMKMRIGRFGSLNPARRNKFRKICGKDRKCFNNMMKTFYKTRRVTRGKFVWSCNRNFPCVMKKISGFFRAFRKVRAASSSKCYSAKNSIKCIQGRIAKFEAAQMVLAKKLKRNTKLKPSKFGRRGGRRGPFRGFVRVHPVRRRFIAKSCPGKNGKLSRNCFRKKMRKILKARRTLLRIFRK